VPTFHVRKPVMLEIEIETADGLSATRMIDEAFQRADPLNTPDVRLRTASSISASARVLDALAQGPALLVEH
jgi:hypothetical protein